MMDENEQELLIQKYRDRFESLGSDLATAFIKNQSGVTFPTAEKQLKREEVGMFWLILAELVTLSIYDDARQKELVDLIVKFRSSQQTRGGDFIDHSDRELD